MLIPKKSLAGLLQQHVILGYSKKKMSRDDTGDPPPRGGVGYSHSRRFHENDGADSGVPKDFMEEDGYDQNIFAEKVDDKYECPVCLLVLKNPMQTTCGHRFCHSCIIRWLRTAPKCPVCNEVLSENMYFHDNFAKREINNLQVKCSNVDNGCPETTELKHLEDHQQKCQYRSVECPNSCSCTVQYRHLEKHMLEKCLKRKIHCPYCQKKIPWDLEESHILECPSHVQKCRHCGNSIPVKEMKPHLEKECPNFPISCTFATFGCDLPIVRKNFDEHLQKNIQYHLTLLCLAMNQLFKQKMPHQMQLYEASQPSYQSTTDEDGPEQDISLFEKTSYGGNGETVSVQLSQLQEIATKMVSTTSDYHSESHQGTDILTAHTSQAGTPSLYTSYQQWGSKEPYSDPLGFTETKFRKGSSGDYVEKSEFVRLKEKCQEQEKKLKKQEKLLVDYQEMHSKLEAKIREKDSKVRTLQNDMAELVGRNCQGTYIWVIEGFSRLRQQAMRGDLTVLHSQGFYTSYYGYKLCIRLNLNGVESAVGSHISVFIHFMQGLYDDILQWPFEGKITLSVLDQNDISSQRQNISEVLVAKPGLAAFKKPTSNRNHKGFGYMEFAPLSMIENSTYVKNDTLVIKASVVEQNN